MLDSYQEQWEATGSLSERQIAWLEKQLDGSWKQKAEPTAKTDDEGGATPEWETDIIQFPTMDPRLRRQNDAMISRKLGEPGKTVVDLNVNAPAVDGANPGERSVRLGRRAWHYRGGRPCECPTPTLAPLQRPDGYWLVPATHRLRPTVIEAR